MGFLKKMLGTSGTTAAASRGDISCRALMLKQGVDVSSKSCDVCGGTFSIPERMFVVIARSVDNYDLDVGGHCPHCRKHICSRHAKFWKMPSTAESADVLEKLEKVAPLFTGFARQGMSWIPACAICGAPLNPAIGKVQDFQF